MNRKEITNLLRSVPGSYDDFVIDTEDWMERDERIKRAILDQIKDNPESDTDDITLVLWNCLGLGEPLEIVDDDDLVYATA